MGPEALFWRRLQRKVQPYKDGRKQPLLHTCRLESGSTVRGIPDAIVFMQGTGPVFLELKAGTKVTPIQAAWHRNVNKKFGYPVFVASLKKNDIVEISQQDTVLAKVDIADFWDTVIREGKNIWNSLPQQRSTSSS